jgi:ubiquinone/menaquinone biosynthesis C-methylase UbiE
MMLLRDAAAAVWWRLIALGFRLLYNELACFYDPVSWTVSMGRWRRWQQTVWTYLPPAGRILEVGPGPGHLLVDLLSAGYQPFGLELSLAMLRLVRQRFGRLSLAIPLCRGDAGSLPFAPGAFDAVVATFPTAYVYDPDYLGEVARVLRPGGRLVIVQMAYFERQGFLSHPLAWLYKITGQSGPGPDLAQLLSQAGLKAWHDTVAVDGSVVGLVLADRS